MCEGVSRLKQSMLEMKDKEIKTCKGTIQQLKEQVKTEQAKKGGQDSSMAAEKERETIEELKAKVHSLAYVNKQNDDLITLLKGNLEKAEKAVEWIT